MKTWAEALKDLDADAVTHCIALGVDINSPIEIPATRAADASPPLPIAYCLAQLGFGETHYYGLSNDSKKPLGLTIIQKLLAAKADISSLHPSRSDIFIQLIDNTYSSRIYHFNAEDDPEEKKETLSEKIAFDAIALLVKQDPSWIQHTWLEEPSDTASNYQPKAGNTALHLALTGHHVNVATYLVELGADKHKPNSVGNTPLHLACMQLSYNTDGFAKENPKDKLTWDKLIEALLLEPPAECDPLLVENIDKKCPLQYIQDPDQALQLIPKTTLTTTLAGHFFTLAIEHQNQTLLAAISEIDLPETMTYNYFPARDINQIFKSHLLSKEANTDIIDELLRRGADINGCDTSGNPPLFYINNINDFEKQKRLFTHLTKRGAHVDVINKKGYTLLLDAVKFSNSPSTTLLSFLLDQGLNINAQTLKGNTVLHHLFVHYREKNQKTISFLMDHGADASIQNNAKQYPIELFECSVYHCSLSLERVQFLSNLLTHCPAAYLPSNAWSLFAAALHSGYTSLAETLLARGFDPSTPDAANAKDHDPTNILRNLASNSALASLRWLKNEERGAAWFTPDNLNSAFCSALNSQTPAHYETAKLLLDAKASVNAQSINGGTVLHEFLHGYIIPLDQDGYDFLRYLRDNGADLEVENSKGKSVMTCLKSSLESSYMRNNVAYRAYTLVRIFMAQGIAFDFSYRELNGLVKTAYSPKGTDFITKNMMSLFPPHLVLNFALCVAIKQSDLAFLNVLLSQSSATHDQIDVIADYDEKITRRSFIHYASHLFQSEQNDKPNYSRLLQALIEKGFAKQLAVFSRLKALQHAIQSRDVSLAQTLLNDLPPKAVDIKVKDSNHCRDEKSLLESAVENNVPEIVDLLATMKADISQKTQEQHSLLNTACAYGHIEAVQALLSHKASPHEYSSEGFHRTAPLETVIHRSKEDTKDSLLNLLLDHGAQENGSISFSFFSQRKKFSKTTIDRFYQNASFAQKREWGWLRQGVILGDLDLIKRLLAEDTNKVLIHEREFSGSQPIHIATAPGATTIFQTLVKAGADIQSCDYEDRNVATHALCHGTLDQLGLKFEFDFDIKSFERFSLSCIVYEKEFERINTNSRLWLSRSYAIKLFSLFQTREHVQAFIDQHRNPESRQPLHDLCQFQLPQHGRWDRSAWATLAMSHGKPVLDYLPWAALIERTLKHPPTTLLEIKKHAANLHYLREKEQPDLARLFITHKIPEPAFNRALEIKSPKQEDHMPDLNIQGQEIDHPGYYLKKLDKRDLRGFILGHLTHCCQSIGSAGEAPSTHGMSSPYGGFYAIFQLSPKNKRKYDHLLLLLKGSRSLEDFLSHLTDKSQKRAYRKEFKAWQDKTHQSPETAINYFIEKFTPQQEGLMVAQCWAWISEDNELVFDSWEQLQRKELGDLCQPFLQAAANQAIATYGYKRVLLGADGQTPHDLSFQTLSDGALPRPRDYWGYRDSNREQYILATQQLLQKKSHDDTQSALVKVSIWQKPAKPPAQPCTPETMQTHITSLLKEQADVHAFAPQSVKDIDTLALTTYIDELITLMKHRTATVQYGFIPSFIQPYVDSAKSDHLHWMGIGLALYQIVGIDTPSIEVHFLNAKDPNLSLSFDRPVNVIEADYLKHTHETGPWLLATLRDFIADKQWGSRLISPEELTTVTSAFTL